MNRRNYLVSFHVVLELQRMLWESESESRSVVSDCLWPQGLQSPWNSPGQNIGVGSLSLFQGIFLTQELNQGPLHCRQNLYQLSGKPVKNALGTIRLCKNVHPDCSCIDNAISQIYYIYIFNQIPIAHWWHIRK